MWPQVHFQRGASVNQQVALLLKDSIDLLLQDCLKWRDLRLCKKVHFAMVSEGLDSVPFFVDQLISSYSACGSLADGNHVFSSILKPHLNAWNVIISAHNKLGHHGMVLNIFDRMQENRVQLNTSTFVCILKACGSEIHLILGRLVHDLIIRNGLETHIFVKNTLVDMYSKCKSLDEAFRVFDDIPEKDAMSWCVMINGYAHTGDSFSALRLFERMQQGGLKPSVAIFLGILKACANLGALWHGSWVHDQVLRSELDVNLLVGSSLVDMYCKSGGLDEARCVFDGLPKRNVVSWGAMITGYADYGHGHLALELFEDMLKLGLIPSRATFLAVLRAFTSVCDNEKGKSAHHQIIKDGLELDEMVGSSLVDMYAKC
eukprot:c24117_g19_i1 orf=984-2105(+)